VKKPVEQRQNELFDKRADLSYFRIYSSMISSGDVAKMGVGAFGLFGILRAYTNWQTGVAIPSIPKLTEMSGASRPTVEKYLNKLVELGYLDVVKREGAPNRYTTKDKIMAIDNVAQQPELLVSQHIPAVFDKVRNQMKGYLAESGVAQDAKVLFQIQTLNITINNVSGDQNVTLNNVELNGENSGKMTQEDVAKVIHNMRQMLKIPPRK